LFTRRLIVIGLLWALLILPTACRQEEAVPTLAPTAATPTTAVADSALPDTQEPPAEPTDPPPSPTPLPPLAALVNDQPIFLSVYEKELARYEQAQLELGVNLADAADYRQLVLDALIEQALIEQAAAQNGITVAPELVDQKLTELRELAGGSQNLDAWLQANQYTAEEFRDALVGEMITERMVDLVTRDVPHAVEQVRARYIQVDDSALAASLHQQIQAGADFALLAQTHSLDRETGQNGGDLGYFAPGALLAPEVEQAAFALEVGATSDVIAVTHDNGQTTYYLVQLIERDPQRPLDANARYNLLRHTFETWLAQRWAEAEIVRVAND
jgi:parvulin-like peptidyl-prolyl isomerase